MAFNTYGALDLTSLSQGETSEEGTRKSASSDPQKSLIVAITEENLQSFVNNSMRLPVLALVWSQRAPESVRLLNSIAALVRQYSGRLQLGSIDGDAHPQIAAAFGIRAIPTMMALLQGQPVPLIEGAVVQDDELAGMVEKILQAATVNGLTGRIDVQDDEEETGPTPYDEGAAALQAGNLVQARIEFEKLLEKNSSDAKALMYMARVDIREKVENLSIEECLAAGAPQSSEGVQACVAYAQCLYVAGREDEACESLLSYIRTLQGDDREFAREAFLHVLTAMGKSDSRVSQYRKKLARILF
ncbi:MAG: tetratricopeptide repeat protein [Actinomycetaceae bacterium]|nr:tetratricopeptide repeat protein [Actinomycetaceae bacterium]